MEEKELCSCNCIYSIKGGWKMYMEMRRMSELKPRKGPLNPDEIQTAPMYYRKLPLEVYLPGYVEVGEVCTGVFAGPRGWELAKKVNELISKKCKDKEYVIFKTMKDYATVSFKIYVKGEDRDREEKK